MSLHKEISFETEICEHLGSHGWLNAEGDAAKYDRARALFPADVLAWVQATQPDAWATLAKNHGAAVAETLLNRLRDQLDKRDGHATAYLWEEVWARDSWLEILGRYLIAQRDAKKQIAQLIFPRFHQLDVMRKLQAAVLKDGPGGKYLVQHSAGSGKTDSIAWTAHLLAELTLPITRRSSTRCSSSRTAR